MDDKKKVVITVKTTQYECELCGYHRVTDSDVNGKPFEMGEWDFDAWSVRLVLEAMGYEVEIDESFEYGD